MSVEEENFETVGEVWSARRVTLVICAGVLSLIALVYLVYYLFTSRPKPSEAGVPTLLFVGLAVLVVLLAPWRDLGFFPTEIAGVKLERVVNAQKKEQIAAIVPLQEELRDLKAKYELLHGAITSANLLLLDKSEREMFAAKSAHVSSQVSEQTKADSREGLLTELLMRFFRNYRGTFFSPIRVQKWGGIQKGFEELLEFSTDEIRQVLFRAVEAGQIKTSISRKGNTLYGLSGRSSRG